MKMRKTITRIMSLASAMLLVLSLVACVDKPSQGGETTTDVAATVNTDVDETTSAFVQDSVPQMNLNTTIGVLAWSDVEHFEFNDELSGEKSVSDLVLNRLNSRLDTVKKRLGIEIEFIGIAGNADNLASWNSYIEKAMQGGDKSFDVIAGYSLSVAKNAASGFLYNLLDSECTYLDFDNPWWSDLLVKEATVNGKMFFASGDISRNALEMMYVCYANTTLLTDYNLENPQNYVASGEWTYEKFISMCEGLYKDLDSSGSKTCTSTEGDQFGYITSGIHVDPWFYGSGATICDKDADGALIPAESFAGERVMNTVSMLNKFLWDTDDGMYTSKVTHQRAFGQGRSLFMMDRARVSHKVLKAEYEVDYVILPCPKYDADQEKYITVMGNPFTLYAIRADAESPENASAFIECMASEGYRQITPAVFELQLKTRYVDDPVSSQMYDLIRENLTFDLGRIFSDSLIGQSNFRNAIKNNSRNWSTAATIATKLLKTKINELMKIFE